MSEAGFRKKVSRKSSPFAQIAKLIERHRAAFQGTWRQHWMAPHRTAAILTGYGGICPRGRETGSIACF
jgi:hypothetical protein